MTVEFSDRMDTLEALLVKISNDARRLPTYTELTTVSDQIFDQIEDHKNRLTAIQHTIYTVKSIITQITR